jgi:hypothetical protein
MLYRAAAGREDAAVFRYASTAFIARQKQSHNKKRNINNHSVDDNMIQIKG